MIIYYTLTKHTRKLKNDAFSLMLTFFLLHGCISFVEHIQQKHIFNSKGWDLTASVTRWYNFKVWYALCTSRIHTKRRI